MTPVRNNKISKKVFFRLPDDVKSVRLQGKDAFDSWKQLNFPLEGDVHETYRATRKEYRQKLRSFLDQTEAGRIRKLCHATESNEKLFWKLVKSQRSSSQMSAFLVNGDLLTDKKAIRAMWADHFEALGTPSEIVLPLTKASLQKLLIVLVRCLVPLLMTQTVFYVNHWSMKKSHGSVLP